MSIAFVSVGSKGFAAPASGFASTAQSQGVGNLILVGVSYWQNLGTVLPVTSGITWGGLAMTELFSVNEGNNVQAVSTSVWGVIGNSLGTKTATVSYTGSAPIGARVSPIVLSGQPSTLIAAIGGTGSSAGDVSVRTQNSAAGGANTGSWGISFGASAYDTGADDPSVAVPNFIGGGSAPLAVTGSSFNPLNSASILTNPIQFYAYGPINPNPSDNRNIISWVYGAPTTTFQFQQVLLIVEPTGVAPPPTQTKVYPGRLGTFDPLDPDTYRTN